jgi:hypothetical protein
MNETAGRRRWRRARPRRSGVLVLTAGLVLLTAACAGSPSSSGGPSSTAAGSSLSARLSRDYLAYSRCMRAHGVPDYPDPNANGQMPAGTNKEQLISNPRLPAAASACRHVIPQSDITAQNQADLGEYVRFAQCMRAHGMPTFPDPVTESDGTPIFNLSSAMTQLPRVRAEALRCMSLLHLAQLPNHRD